MITYLTGKLTEKTPTHAVVECNGIGYFLHISLYTYSQLPEAGEVKLHTHLLIREDAHTLFGFCDAAEREIFRLLISVSGIGAGTARTLLSAMTPPQVRDAIAAGNAAAMQTIKGIGAKTAQRLVVDLKDKILKIHGIDQILPVSNNTTKEQALSALEVLGFSRKASEGVIDKILKNTTDLSVEGLIKEALKNM